MNAVKFGTPEENAQFRELMRQNGLSFLTDARGSTWYSVRESADVLGLIRLMTYGSETDPNRLESATVWTSALQTYRSELKAAGIPFHAEQVQGEEGTKPVRARNGSHPWVQILTGKI